MGVVEDSKEAVEMILELFSESWRRYTRNEAGYLYVLLPLDVVDLILDL